MEAEVVTLQDLFKFKYDDAPGDGKIAGGLCATGLRPASMHKFEKRGIPLPLTMFQPGGVQVAVGAAGSKEKTTPSPLSPPDAVMP